jgi:hypothetical protein
MAFFSPRQLTAIHESGHACAAVAHGLYVYSATIKPSHGLNGSVTWHRNQGDSAHYHLVTAMAGPIAGHHALGTPCSFYGYPQDLETIRDLLGGRYNDERPAPEFQRALLAAWSFVRKRQHSIHRVAHLLLIQTTARHTEIVRVM